MMRRLALCAVAAAAGDAHATYTNASPSLGADACDLVLARPSTSGVIPAGDTWTIPCTASRSREYFRSASVFFDSGSTVNIVVMPAACASTAPSPGAGDSAVSTTSQAAVSVLNRPAPAGAASCIYVRCLNFAGSCTGVYLSAAYYTPPVNGTPCAVTDVGLPAAAAGALIPGGASGTFACRIPSIPSNYRQSVSIANPTGALLSVSVTDGSDCARAASGLSYSSYVSTARASGSVSFSSVACVTSPCCTIVRCLSANGADFPCLGLRITTSYGTASSPAALPAGAIVAIVFVAVALSALAAHRARRYRQQQLYGADGGTTVIVTTNNAQAFASAYESQPQPGYAYGAPQYGGASAPQWGAPQPFPMAPPPWGAQPGLPTAQYAAGPYGAPPPFGAPQHGAPLPNGAPPQGVHLPFGAAPGQEPGEALPPPPLPYGAVPGQQPGGTPPPQQPQPQYWQPPPPPYKTV